MTGNVRATPTAKDDGAPKPPARPRRSQAERRAATRRLLLDATYESILTSGYRSTTTRRVADMSGVSLGALAHHFPTRVELVAASMDDAGRRALNDMRDKLQSAEGSRGDRARFALDLLWEYFGGDLFIVWIKVWFAAAEEPELLAAMRPVERRISDLVSTLSDEIIPGSMRQAKSRNKVRFAMAAMRGLGISRLLAPNQPTAVVSWESARVDLLDVLGI